MPVLTTDIQYRLSGGASNSDPILSLGGAKSSVAITPATLFDTISGAESAAGDTEYRCFYIHNAHGSLPLNIAKIWLETQSAAYHAIALGGEGLNGTAETVGNESTAPSGESFTSPANEGAGLSLGTIPAGQHYPVWVRRIIPAVTGAAAITFTLRVKGDTDA